MFPKEMIVYRLSQPLTLSAEELGDALKQKPARRCAAQELATCGFVPALGKGADSFVHVGSGYWLVALEKHTRDIKPKVVKREVQRKVDEIEENQKRKVYRKERGTIKDEVMATLLASLPPAFEEMSQTRAIIHPTDGVVMVLTGTPKKAEELLSMLREAMGSLPVRPLTVKIAPAATFTSWLKTSKAGDGFFMLDNCTLTDTHEEGGSVECKRQDLTSDEIQLHLSSGKLVSKIVLAYQDKFRFTVDEKLIIKQMRFEDLLQDQAEQDGGDDALGQLDASFNIVAPTLGAFIPDLIQALGGEEMPQGI